MKKNARKRASSSFETRATHAPQDEEALHPIALRGQRGRGALGARAAGAIAKHALCPPCLAESIAKLYAERMSIDVPGPVQPPVQPPVDGALRLCVDNLGVLRGGRRVLDHLSFSLAAGQALIVTGPNGAGKSTLLRALAGLLPRAGGSIALEGGPSDVELPQQAHYLAHSDGMKAALTVEENLDFWSRYLAQEPDRRSRTVGAALGVVGLSHVAAAPFGVLSAGQKRRAALARLLVAFRPLWLLDEPLTALDRASREKFALAMSDHCGQGGLIVAATHEPLGLEEAASLALGSAS